MTTATLTVARIATQRVRHSDTSIRPEPLRAWFYAEVAGLCITEWPGIEGDPHSRYSITHTDSGARIGGTTYHNRASAEAALSRVAGMFDWTQTFENLQAAYRTRARTDAEFERRLACALLAIPEATRAA